MYIWQLLDCSRHPNIPQIFGVCESKLTPGDIPSGLVARQNLDGFTLKEIGHFVGGAATVQSLNFSSRGNEVVSCSEWAAASGSRIAEYHWLVECT